MIVFAALLALLIAGPAEDEWIVDPTVRPIAVSGRKVGCELEVGIAHGTDRAAPDAVLRVVVGLVYTGDDEWNLRLAARHRSGAAPARAPEAAYFVVSEGSTEHEAVERDVTPARLFQAFAGDKTRVVFADLSATGAAKIAFRMNGGATRIWTLDLAGRPDVRDEFALCLAPINLDA